MAATAFLLMVFHLFFHIFPSHIWNGLSSVSLVSTVRLLWISKWSEWIFSVENFVDLVGVRSLLPLSVQLIRTVYSQWKTTLKWRAKKSNNIYLSFWVEISRTNWVAHLHMYAHSVCIRKTGAHRNYLANIYIYTLWYERLYVVCTS